MNRCSALFVYFFTVSLFAQDALHIMEETQQRAKSKSERYEGILEVQNPTTKLSTKRWTFDRLGSGGESKSLLRFTAPQELAGLALLIVNHPDKPSEQWMWTPAIGRERRVATQDRSTRFFGTDFSFEDLEDRDITQFDYKLVGDSTVDGTPCWKLESKPKQTRTSQYSSSTIWVRKDNYVIAQIENYQQDKLTRKIRYSDTVKQNNIWTPRTIEISDPARNSRTILKIEKLQYNLPMRPDDFTVDALRRN